MKRRVAAVLALSALALAALPRSAAAQAAEPRPLRIICFGAHPDDCELQTGGSAIKWAAKGHKVIPYYTDRFQKPNPFKADIVVDIDDVVEKKVAALELLESQFLEGGALASAAS